jgi:uncharacterized membrane protein
MNDFLFALRFATALACGLMAGVFFAFSTFVMKGLSRLPAATGISAMQAINSGAVHSFFLAAFLGTSAACFLVAFSSVLQWSHPSAVYSLAGGLAFLAGGFLVTMIFNVERFPRNSFPDGFGQCCAVGLLPNELDKMEPPADGSLARRFCAPDRRSIR